MQEKIRVGCIGKYDICLGGVSEIGIDKKCNQDAFSLGIDEKNELAYIIVADGLGSCKHSEQGSARIVEIVENWLKNKLPEYSFLSNNVVNILAKRMIEEWNASYNVDEIYDYDTTVHMIVYYKGSMLIGGIGDGMALLSVDDSLCKDYVDGKQMFSNVTSSMCSLDVHELMEFELISLTETTEQMIGIVSTDGIADDIIPEKKLTLPGYFKEVLAGSGVDSLQSELVEWIDSWETEGHSDDKTICYLAIGKEGQYV